MIALKAKKKKKSKKKKDEKERLLSSFTVLKLKLEDVPDRADELSALCKQARNAGSENWLLRQRGLKEIPKQAKLNAKSGKPLSETTKIYHAMMTAIPALPSHLATTLNREVYKILTTDLPWTSPRVPVDDDEEELTAEEQAEAAEDEEAKETRKRKRYEAILNYEERIPYYTADQIPIPAANSELEFGDELILVLTGWEPRQKVRLKISLKKMPPAKKKILHEIASKVPGTRKFQDASLLKKNGVWFLYLPVEYTLKPLDNDKRAVLYPVVPSWPSLKGRNGMAFILKTDNDKDWDSGDGWYLLRETKRLTGIRKLIGWKYKHGRGHGHGREKVSIAIANRYKQQADAQNEFRNQAINDIVDRCVRRGCGVLEYREPSGPAKKLCWFATVGLEINWSTFSRNLINACHHKRIRVIVKNKLNWGDITPAKPKKKKNREPGEILDEIQELDQEASEILETVRGLV